MNILASILVVVGYTVLIIGVALFVLTAVKKLVDNGASHIRIFDIEIAVPGTLMLAVFGGLLAVAGTFGPMFLSGSQASRGDSHQSATPVATQATGPTVAAGPTGVSSAEPGLASASCVSPPSRDAGGTTFTYGPEKAVDGIPDTAWRCDGDGVGQRLQISFPGRVTLTGIGIVPGYAKTDPVDGTDRYSQNRRISAVSYTFDEGSAVTESLDTDASRRSPQALALPNVSTSHVTITILGSVDGEANGGRQPFDKVAISEVTLSVR